MWLAGEVFPRAWKLLGMAWPALRLSGSLLVGALLFAIAWEVGCLMHGGWMHQPAAETHPDGCLALDASEA
jgi:hypothetical protein